MQWLSRVWFFYAFLWGCFLYCRRSIEFVERRIDERKIIVIKKGTENSNSFLSYIIYDICTHSDFSPEDSFVSLHLFLSELVSIVFKIQRAFFKLTKDNHRTPINTRDILMILWLIGCAWIFFFVYFFFIIVSHIATCVLRESTPPSKKHWPNDNYIK